MRLVVSMPTYRTPEKLLRRAVSSVLAQTFDDLALVLVVDGYSLPIDVLRDSRIVVYQLAENMGRYFADAVTTRAIVDRPDLIWSVHDADDWSEPERFERLLPAMDDGAVVARYWRHDLRGTGRSYLQEPARAKLRMPTGGFVHLAHWASGAYTSERVARAGGIHPGYRVGFDTLFVRMIALTGHVGISSHAHYHWCRRAGGSLTTSPETRFGSTHRAEAKRKLMRLDDLAWDAARAHGDPGQVIRDDIDPSLSERVDEHAARLRRELVG